MLGFVEGVKSSEAPRESMIINDSEFNKKLTAKERFLRCLDDTSTGPIGNLSEKVEMRYPDETYYKDCRAFFAMSPAKLDEYPL